MSELISDVQARVVSLLVQADLQEAGNEQAQAMAYAFSRRGGLLSAGPIKGKDGAILQIAVLGDPQEITLVVGPRMREGEKTTTLAELHRQGAESRVIRVDAASERLVERFTIAPDVWHCWIRGLYHIHGHVIKRLGTTDLPIVDATVEIYEVDPISIIIPRLPDLVVEEIRRRLIDPRPPVEAVIPQLTMPHLPFIPPIPVPDTAPMAMAAHEPSAPTASMAAIPSNLAFVAHNAGTFQLRQELVLHPEIVRHILCLIHPVYVTKQLVATATTDRCGDFSAWATQGCDRDRPDLYFIVRQRVFPLLPPIAIYAPTPVPCYTHWNYLSGSEVTIVVTHPLAIPSAPCPNTTIPEFGVVVEAIGNTSLDNIFGTSSNEPEPVTNTNRGLTHDGRPWGGTLRLRLDFDPALRDHGVRYYRVGYRRGTSGAFIDLDLPIRRFYRTYGGANPVDTLYPLGPNTIGSTQHLYEIPPALPLPANSVWIVKDLFEDTIHAKFPTAQIAPGIAHTSPGPDNASMFQLRVDLFDGGGNLVDLAATGVQFYVPTSDDPTPAADLGLVSGNGFVMALHVDNNPCFAQIETPVDQDGNAAGTECGVIEYARDAMGNKLGTVTMSYTAAHRNGFARYSFTLYRGANVRTLPGFAGTPALPVGNAPVSPTPISHTQPVAALLGTCDVAGFSQNLYVDALATDGLTNELGYDASAVFAFALAPQS